MLLQIVLRIAGTLQNLHKKKSSKKAKEILKKSFKEILKNGLMICLDYFLLPTRKFTITY